jgi:hypothetical protein
MIYRLFDNDVTVNLAVETSTQLAMVKAKK